MVGREHDAIQEDGLILTAGGNRKARAELSGDFLVGRDGQIGQDVRIVRQREDEMPGFPLGGSKRHSPLLGVLGDVEDEFVVGARAVHGGGDGDEAFRFGGSQDVAEGVDGRGRGFFAESID